MSVTSVTHRGLRAWAAAAALGLAALLGGCSEESAESTGVGAPSLQRRRCQVCADDDPAPRTSRRDG